MESYLMLPELTSKKEIPELSSLMPLFLTEQDVSDASKETYQTGLEQFFLYLKKEKIACPNRADLITYKKELSKTHSAKTVNLRLSVIRTFFAWTQAYGVYPNIAAGIKGERTNNSPKRQPLTSGEVQEILESIDTSTLCGRQKYAIVLICSANGLRISEISKLDISDLLVIRNQTVLRIQGKGYTDKSQLVPIGKATASAIRSALALRNKYHPSDPMFISTSPRCFGSRISSKGIGQLLKNILKENNFLGSFYTAHSFRHTACCLALEVTDNDIVSVRDHLRHESVETTMIYANSDSILKNDICDKVENLILNS